MHDGIYGWSKPYARGWQKGLRSRASRVEVISRTGVQAQTQPPPGKRTAALGRDTEELGDVLHLPQLDLVAAEDHVSELRESVPMLDQLGCRGRIPLAPIARKNASFKQPLDATEPQLAGGPVGLGEGAGLDLDSSE